MNLNQFYIHDNSSTYSTINGMIHSSDLIGIKTRTGDASKNNSITTLMDMEKANAALENLLKENTKKLNEVIETNTKFMTIVAHDLRSPFCSILGALDLLKEKLEESNVPDIEGYIDIASNSANKTLGLLDGLLEWSFSQNERKSFNPEKINLQSLLNEEIETIHMSSIQKHIAINNNVEINLNIMSDIQMIRTIIRNLTSNAIKFTKDGGHISISATNIGTYAEICVKDDGIGISEDDQKELFKVDKFHSIPGTNNEQGAGLGLLICKEFIQLHGGDISIISEVGLGSKFIFTMPLCV